MGSKPKEPPAPEAAPPPIRSSAADAAQDSFDQKNKERKRYDFSKTILNRGSTNSDSLNGQRRTLG